MERLTREQMVTEFGEPGVENAMLLDLISVDPATDKVVLTMIERRAWGANPRQFQQIEEKINRYLGYVLDGFLAEQHPAYEGKRVQIRLQCVEEPNGEAVRFVAAATQAVQAEGIEFVVAVARAAGMTAEGGKPAKPRRSPPSHAYFATPADFRAWLTANHATAPELLVGFHKVDSGKPSITWPQSVDQALCFGWIDGVRRSLGATAYTIRFTPRRPRSIWSTINTRRFAALEAEGQVAAAGRAAFAARDGQALGRLQLRASEAAHARPRAAQGVRRQREGVGVLHVAPALVPARRGALGGQRQEAGDARQAPAHADRRLRRRPHHRAAHAPVTHSNSHIPAIAAKNHRVYLLMSWTTPGAVASVTARRYAGVTSRC